MPKLCRKSGTEKNKLVYKNECLLCNFIHSIDSTSKNHISITQKSHTGIRMLQTRRFLSSNPMNLRKNLISLNQKRAQSISQMRFENNEALISNSSAFKHLHESGAFTKGLNLSNDEHGFAVVRNASNEHYLELLQKVSHQILFLRTILLGNLGKIPLLNAPNICQFILTIHKKV